MSKYYIQFFKKKKKMNYSSEINCKLVLLANNKIMMITKFKTKVLCDADKDWII